MKTNAKTFFEQEVERLILEDTLLEHHYTHIRQSKSFMETYFSDKIELNEIAAAAFMSRFHYIRIFQQVYGMSPRRYLRDIRIERAKELFKKGHSVEQVCIEIGYDSLSTFSNIFKQFTGYSPKKYRKLHISNPE